MFLKFVINIKVRNYIKIIIYGILIVQIRIENKFLFLFLKGSVRNFTK